MSAVTPAGNPTLWAPLILVGIVTVLFGLTDVVAWLNSQSIGLRLLAVVLTVVASAAAWFLTSMSLPHEECEWWELTPGAAMVGTGVGLLHVLTITYIAYEVSRKSSLYGAIGISIALLLWTYFAGRLLTAAIATNATLWKRRRARTSTIELDRATVRSPESLLRVGNVEGHCGCLRRARLGFATVRVHMVEGR